MKLQLSSMMMANSIRSCAQLRWPPIDGTPRPAPSRAWLGLAALRPRAVPKVEQTMTSSWQVFVVLTRWATELFFGFGLLGLQAGPIPSLF